MHKVWLRGVSDDAIRVTIGDEDLGRKVEFPFPENLGLLAKGVAIMIVNGVRMPAELFSFIAEMNEKMRGVN